MRRQAADRSAGATGSRLSGIGAWFSRRTRTSTRRRNGRSRGFVSNSAYDSVSEKLVAAEVESLENRELLVAFAFDFRFDTAGFFNNADRRATLALAGQIVGNNINDALAAIAPAGANTWTPTIRNPATGAVTNLPGNTVVNANQILVFAGGRDLSDGQLGEGGFGGFSANGSAGWLSTVGTRGQAGAALNPRTDVGIWGGSITFDTVGTAWHFGRTTAGLDPTEADFLSVAVHELTHLIGFVSSQGSFARLISSTGKFTGPTATAANGNVQVSLSADRSHWAEGTRTDWGRLEAAMDPSLTLGTRKLLGALDYAGLRDLGWQTNRYGGWVSDDTMVLARTALARPAGVGTVTTAFNEILSTPTDVDFHRVFAVAGTRMTVSLSEVSGQPGINTALRLFDLAGGQMATSNVSTSISNDTLVFTFNRTDYYFVGVSTSTNFTYNPTTANSGPGGPTGNYRISIRLESSANPPAAPAIIAGGGSSTGGVTAGDLAANLSKNSFVAGLSEILSRQSVAAAVTLGSTTFGPTTDAMQTATTIVAAGPGVTRMDRKVTSAMETDFAQLGAERLAGSFAAGTLPTRVDSLVKVVEKAVEQVVENVDPFSTESSNISELQWLHD